MSFELAAETLVCDCFVNKGQNVAMKTQQHNTSVRCQHEHSGLFRVDFTIKDPTNDLDCFLGYESAVGYTLPK